jgi:hypothetical protein
MVELRMQAVTVEVTSVEQLLMDAELVVRVLLRLLVVMEVVLVQVPRVHLV